MPNCQLTAKDSFILKALLSEPGHPDDLRAIVREKLRSASLFLDHTIDRKVATIGSRVRFAVGATFHERVLSANPDSTIGLELSLTSLMGAVLVGMKEEQITHIRHKSGQVTRVELLKVLSQPETQRGGIAQDAEVVYVDFRRRSPTSNRVAPYDDGPGAA
jgi:regulator of nucleoside diphosphate kinase